MASVNPPHLLEFTVVTLFAQLTRDLLAKAKFLFFTSTEMYGMNVCIPATINGFLKIQRLDQHWGLYTQPIIAPDSAPLAVGNLFQFLPGLSPPPKKNKKTKALHKHAGLCIFAAGRHTGILLVTPCRTVTTTRTLGDPKLRRGRCVQCRPLVSDNILLKCLPMLGKLKSDPTSTPGSGSTPKFNHF